MLVTRNTGAFLIRVEPPALKRSDSLFSGKYVMQLLNESMCSWCARTMERSQGLRLLFSNLDM
jgi:hypothetical protein